VADNLKWLNVSAFPGIDESSSDHLIQPRGRGPALMRRMIGVDPFKSVGEFTAEGGFAEFMVADAPDGLFSHVGASAYLLKVDNGVLSYLSGETWTVIDDDLEPGARVYFATIYGGLFYCDGHHRLRVWGWNYDPSDLSLTWNTAHTLAEVLYTYGQQGHVMPAFDAAINDDDFVPDGIAFHMQRSVIWKGNEVRMSWANRPTVYYDADVPEVAECWMLVGEGDGNAITTAFTFDNQMLLVSKPNSLHGYTGTDPQADYSHLTLDASRGIYAPDSVALGGGRMYFCSYDGPCSFDTTNGVKDISGALTAVWARMGADERKQVVGWWEDGCWHISVPIVHQDVLGAVPDVATASYTFDPLTKMWTHGWAVHGLTASVNPETGDRYTLTYADGTIWQQNLGTLYDTEVPIQELETPWLEFGDPYRWKWIRRMMFEMVQGPETVSLQYCVDGDDSWRDIIIPGTRPLFAFAEDEHKWGEPGLVFNAPGNFTVDMPMTWHCHTLKLRLRAAGLGIKSFGIGYAYEGV